MTEQSPQDFAPAADSAGATTFMAVMITRRCNMTCGHCSVASGPGVKSEPSEDQVMDHIEALLESGVRSIQITGGEPMLRPELVARILRRCVKAGVVCSLSTNGFWGRDPAEASRRVREFLALRLGLVTVSYDRFHAAFQDGDAIRNIVEACAGQGLPMNLNITRMKDDDELAGLVALAGRHPKIRVRFYDVQPVGRAKHLDASELREETEGACYAARNPVLTDNGRIMACNGPSYFTKPDSPLHVGVLEEGSAARLLEFHRTDLILETIRVFGPSRLRRELERAGPVDGFRFRDRYHGLCDLCAHINTAPTAVAVLRQRLDRPEYRAELAATKKVSASYGKRFSSVDKVNRTLARRFFFQLACDPARSPQAADPLLLGRADLDWKEVGDYLIACGLGLALSASVEREPVASHAPTFFKALFRRSAESTQMRLLLVRQALRVIDGSLQELGIRGCLLKGAVVAAHPDPTARTKAPGDIDLLVDPNSARPLEESLLSAGFEVARPARAYTEPNGAHGRPLRYRGIMLEIHTRICRAHHGLPESFLLERQLPLQGNLDMLRPEAMFFHVTAHNMWHHGLMGMRSAWLADWILRRYPDFDWVDLAEIVRRTPTARAFWAPLGLWHDVLGFPVPEAFVAARPRDRIQKRLDRVARLHGLSSVGSPGERENFLIPAVTMLSCGDVRWLGPTATYAAKHFLKEAGRRTLWSLQEIGSSPSIGEWASKRAKNLRRSYRAFVAG